LPGLQDRKQSRVDDQGLGVPDQLGKHDPAQGLQEAPKPPHPSVERGRVQSPTTPGNRCETNLSASRKNERSLSMPRNCSKRASAMTSESESLFMDSEVIVREG